MQKLKPMDMKTKFQMTLLHLSVYQSQNYGYTKNGKRFNICCQHNQCMYFEFRGSKKRN